MKKLFLLLGLAGCAQTSDVSWSPGLMTENSAYIVVYENPAWKKTSQAVDINGEKACDLVQGGFFAKAVPFGKYTISSSIWDLPGRSRATVNINKVGVTYVRTQYDVVFGNGGPFLIESVDERTARAELKSLHMMQCN